MFSEMEGDEEASSEEGVEDVRARPHPCFVALA
jgi:hypothetical protein